MIYLSKSKYCNFWQCPKMAWLNKYKPEAKTEDPSLEARFIAGNEVGDLAMGLFGEFIEVTAYKEDGSLGLGKMIEDTKTEIEKGTSNICEASFSYNGLYCAVDILKKEDNGWGIYEVKSSTNNDEKQEVKAVYVADISYQKYVLEHCGVKVTSTNLVSLNTKYIRGEELDITKLFYVMNVDDLVEEEICNVEPNIKLAEEIMNCKDEPDCDLDMRCKDPYDCLYWEYCTRHLPEKSVFNDAEVLQDKGKVTAAIAKEFAESEFEKYRVIQDAIYQSDFDKKNRADGIHRYDVGVDAKQYCPISVYQIL